MGLDDLRSSDTNRAETAGYVIAVFGRSVTLTLQNIRTYVDRDEFDSFWVPKQELMAGDPLLRFYNDLRNAFLKEGGLWKQGQTMFGTAEQRDPPYDWKWYYTNSPTQHRGYPIPMLDGHAPTILQLGSLYFDFLYKLLQETAVRFTGAEWAAEPSAPPPGRQSARG